MKRLSDVTYRVQHTSNRAKRVVVHFDRLKKCHPNTRLQEESTRTSPSVTDLPPSPNTHKSPFGTTLQIIEDSDCAPGQGVASSPTSPEQSTSPQPIHPPSTHQPLPTQPHPPNPAPVTPRRYPARARRPPVFFDAEYGTYSTKGGAV